MKNQEWKKSIVCCAVLASMAGCQSFSQQHGDTLDLSSVAPLVVQDSEVIIRDQLIVLVDVTGSIGSGSMYRWEKNLVQAFTAAMPDGTYEAGIDSFAGVSSSDWVEQPLARYDRGLMNSGAARIRPLGSTTPLARAIQYQKNEVAGVGGRGALVIFSDGKVLNPLEVLQACRDLKMAHGGEFCIYTVLIGSDREGAELMQEMANVTGCGKFYDGTYLNTAASVDTMVRDIFLGVRDVQQVTITAPEGLPLNLRNILFDNDSSVVASSYDGQLNEIAAIMARNPSMRIRLDGHTDFNASDAYNQRLSERRVNSVKAALVQRNADASRLNTNAYGELRPTVPNDSPEHLHQNRRVELTVVE